MYVVGFLAAAVVIWKELLRKRGPVSTYVIPEMLFYSIFAVLIGGRLGHVLIYEPEHYWKFPHEIIATWEGGMSFHGGLVGLIALGLLWAHRRKVYFLAIADLGALASPIGIMLAKIGNFINGELYGRVTDISWGIVFPCAGPIPRHPSQLYEAVVEGPLLFIILWSLRKKADTSGIIFAAFLISYGTLRFFVEFFREPDPPIGLILGAITMGQVLCLSMIAAGVILILYLRKRKIAYRLQPTN
jgi:phosphatidylglycerol:prolipoprotein diacylglycerol transferase